MNPLLLLAIGGLLAFIILMLVFKTRKQRVIILLLFAVGGACAGWYGYKEFTRTNEDLAKVKADIKVTATQLVGEYKTNDSTADKKYLNKIIEVEGNVKKVEKDEKGNYTIVLGDTSLLSIRCSMDTVHQQDAALLNAGSSTIVRGAYSGFKKNELMGVDLGSDVELVRCAVIKKKN